MWFKDNFGEPIFREPGVYHIKLPYLVDLKRETYVETEITIKVRTPEGDDRHVYEILKRDPALAAALLSAVSVPKKELLPKIEDLIKRFPRSSYEGLARFAKARFHLQSNGFADRPHVGRVPRAFAADELEHILGNSQGGAYTPNVLIAWAMAAPLEYEWNVDDSRFSEEYPDSLEWLERFAQLLAITNSSSARASKARKLVEDLSGRKWPPAQGEAERTFIAEVWTTWRKDSGPALKKRAATGEGVEH
ncbi:MAG: hypothetical protein L0Z62_08570 [Gemmataceae bacterium]|nr:hypothetical protein [Gemmataceae bacterium]